MFSSIRYDYSAKDARSRNYCNASYNPYRSASTLILGDTDGIVNILDLTVQSIRTATTTNPNIQLILLGDNVNPWHEDFPKSIPYIKELLSIRGIPYFKEYADIEDVFNNFSNDVRELLVEKHFEYLFDTSTQARSTKNSRPGYSKIVREFEYDPTDPLDNDDKDVIILGNKDFHAMINIAYPIPDCSEIVIHNETPCLHLVSKMVHRDMEVNEDNPIGSYYITVEMANILYTYFRCCRTVYVTGEEEKVAYIHLGNMHKHAEVNDARISNIDHMKGNEKVKYIVSGHEKMYGGYTYNGRTYCNVDNSAFYEAYDGTDPRNQLSSNTLGCVIVNNEFRFLHWLHMANACYVDQRIDDKNDHRPWATVGNETRVEVKVLGDPLHLVTPKQFKEHGMKKFTHKRTKRWDYFVNSTEHDDIVNGVVPNAYEEAEKRKSEPVSFKFGTQKAPSMKGSAISVNVNRSKPSTVPAYKPPMFRNNKFGSLAMNSDEDD